jgi:hypothetical protein
VTSNEIVLRVLTALEQLGIPYMLVGSYSSNAFGVARSTQDADFVIELGNQSATALFQALAPDLQFDPQMRLETVTMTGRYVGRHPGSGFKVELFLLSDEPHDQERFRRRQRRAFLTGSAYLPSPEDVVIQKLKWFQRSRRAKDVDDARNVLAVQAGRLDLDYIRRWCDRHATRSLFEELLVESRRFEQEA